MRVLAIDTALEACAAAVLDTVKGGLLASEQIPMARGHAEALMPMVSRLIAEAHLAFGELDRIAVTVGPGSFTGLRVGVSAARALALAASKPVVGLTTLAAFAAPLIADDDTTAVLAAIDARHAQVYMQLLGPSGRTLIAPRLTPITDAILSVGAMPVRIVGSGAAMVAEKWPAHLPPPLSVDALAAPHIDWIAYLGAAAHEQENLPKPLYLRAPDAQPKQASALPRR